MTIGQMKAQGITGIHVMCPRVTCRHIADVPFTAIPHDDADDFETLRGRWRRYRCTKCGETTRWVTPDWRGWSAPGKVKDFKY